MRPIANKYLEGKLQRTLKRELKEPEIVYGEGLENVAGLCTFSFRCVTEVVPGEWPIGCTRCCRGCVPEGLFRHAGWICLGSNEWAIGMVAPVQETVLES